MMTGRSEDAELNYQRPGLAPGRFVLGMLLH